MIFDIETTGLRWDSKFQGAAWSAGYGEEIFFTRSMHKLIDHLIKTLEQSIYLVGHNIICFDLPWLLYNAGTHRKRLLSALQKHSYCLMDTLIMSQKLFPSRFKHSMDSWVPHLEAEYEVENKTEVEDFATASPELIEERVTGDVNINAALWDKFYEDMGAPEAVSDYEFDLEWFQVVLEMQVVGVPFDLPTAKRLSCRLRAQQALPRDRLQQRAEINWGSRVQVHKYLQKHEGEGLPLSKKGRPSLNKKNREAVCQKYPYLHDIFKISDAQSSLDYINPHSPEDSKKYMGNFLLKSPILAVPAVYPKLSYVGTRSYRMQWSQPPLQQMAKTVRQVNILPEGWVFIGCDVVALEMTIFGYLLQEICGEDAIIQEIKEGKSAKKLTICAFGELFDKVVLHGAETIEDVAKQTNYSVLYGIAPATLAANLNLPKTSQIKNQLLGAIERRFPSFRLLTTTMTRMCDKNGVIANMFGNKVVTEAWKALNAYIQSSGADYAKRMMWIVWKILKGIDDDILPAIYNMDELQFVAPARVLKQHSESYIKKEVNKYLPQLWNARHPDYPLLTGVDIKIGRSWKETH